MKKSVFVFALLVFFASAGFGSAVTCSLDAQIINQDPYPAMPDDYVKVVFQVSGVENPECGTVRFELIQEYPFSLDPGNDYVYSIQSGTFVNDYESFFLAPYRLRVDADALEGENEVRVKLTNNFDAGRSQTEIIDFNITVEDVRTDFEVFVKDVDFTTNIVTFEVLNIGESDVEALTIEAPVQDSFSVKGTNRNIVGDLDAGEDTTFSFEALPSDGEIEFRILYNDEINIRREVVKTVRYDSSFFTNRKGDEVQPKTASYYVSIILALVLIFIWFRAWRRKRNKKKKMREGKR